MPYVFKSHMLPFVMLRITYLIPNTSCDTIACSTINDGLAAVARKKIVTHTLENGRNDIQPFAHFEAEFSEPCGCRKGEQDNTEVTSKIHEYRSMNPTVMEITE